MVRRTLKAITGKISGLHEAAFWLASFSIFSQILAFLRDRLLAHNFGAGHELDLYYAAFEVPDLLFTTTASLVGASILLPLFAKFDNHVSSDASEKLDGEDSKNNLKKYINSVFTTFFFLLVFCCVLAFIFMPALVPLFFKNLGPSNIAEVVKFSRILLLSPLFLGLSNFFGSISQYEKRFLLYSISPLLYNAGIILGAVFGAAKFGIVAIVFGVSLGAFMHMFLQLYWVFSSGNAPKFTSKLDWQEIKKTFLLSVPRTISLSATSLVGLFFVSLASRFGEGAIAIFNFSLNLQSVPLVIIGASYSLAAFPSLAGYYVKKELAALSECLGAGLRHIVFWSLPVAALFIVLRAHIVRVVLGSGRFDWADTRMTAAALSIFVLSVVFQSIQLFLTRAHYAFGRTKLPLIVNLGSAVFTVVFALLITNFAAADGQFFSLLSSVLKVQGLGRTFVLALPLAFSLGSFLSALFLWFGMEKEIRNSVLPSLLGVIRDSVLTAAIIGVATSLFLKLFSKVFSLDFVWSVFLHAFVSGVLGIVLGVLFLIFIRNKEFLEIKDKFKRLVTHFN